MGSADLSCVTLERLVQRPVGELVGVVARPAKPKGRRLKVSPCPVGACAQRVGVHLLTPPRVNDPEVIEALRDLAPDVIVVVAYGQILKTPILELPPLGCVNIHTSLLPYYRGAAPIQWAIANGETVTGVTTIFMNERMDAGDILVQRSVPIQPADTAGTLHDRLAVVGAEALLSTLDQMASGALVRHPQDDAEATLAPKLTKEDGHVDWTRSAREVHDRVRGFTPWPGAFSLLPRRAGGRLRLLRTDVVTEEEVEARGCRDHGVGHVLCTQREAPLIRASQGGVHLLEVQPAGGRAMSGQAYLNGHDLREGDRLE